MVTSPTVKPVLWVGRTKDDLSILDEDVRDTVGQALFAAQKGGKHASAKPLGGYGDASVLEIVVDHAGDTFRTVYTVRWPGRVYVLHVFQKKSKSRIRTPKVDMDLINSRLKRLSEMHSDDAKKEEVMRDNFTIKEGSGNVFADLGLPDAEERLTKADLALRIAAAIRARRLTQMKAAALLGIDQPKISRLLKGQLSGFSTDRLIHFLTLLGQDVMIVVKASATRSSGLGHVTVVTEGPVSEQL